MEAVTAGRLMMKSALLLLRNAPQLSFGRKKASRDMGKGKSGFMVIVALAALIAVIAMLYRSASHDELPDDEWLDFDIRK